MFPNHWCTVRRNWDGAYIAAPAPGHRLVGLADTLVYMSSNPTDPRRVLNLRLTADESACTFELASQSDFHELADRITGVWALTIRPAESPGVSGRFITSAYCTNGVYSIRLGGSPTEADWSGLLVTLLRLQTVGLVTDLVSSSRSRGYDFRIVNGAEGCPGLAWFHTALGETAVRQAQRQ